MNSTIDVASAHFTNNTNTTPVDLDFGFTKVKYSSFLSVADELVNKHEQVAFQESIQLFESMGAFKTPKQLKVTKKSQVGLLAARTFPHAEHDGLRLSIDLFIILFLLDDIADVIDATDAKAMEQAINVECQLIKVLRGADPKPSDHALSHCMKSIIDRMAHLNQDWITLVRQEFIKYLEIGHMERLNRNDGKTLSWPMFENTRYYSVCAAPFIYLSAAMLCKGSPEDLPFMSYMEIMKHLAIKHIAFVNDIVSFNKERYEAVNNNIIIVLANDRDHTCKDAIGDAIKLSNQNLETFLKLESALITKLDPTIHGDSLAFIDVLKNCMRGNIDWHFESVRYRTSQ
uniref:Terpene synthase n=1 Tax=Laurencia subopposita TaxID=3071698 RepID=A0AA96UY11_9FLOR|nr:TS-1 [Laurencia subopposita]